MSFTYVGESVRGMQGHAVGSGSGDGGAFLKVFRSYFLVPPENMIIIIRILVARVLFFLANSRAKVSPSNGIRWVPCEDTPKQQRVFKGRVSEVPRGFTKKEKKSLQLPNPILDVVVVQYFFSKVFGALCATAPPALSVHSKGSVLQGHIPFLRRRIKGSGFFLFSLSRR